MRHPIEVEAEGTGVVGGIEGDGGFALVVGGDVGVPVKG